MEKGNQEGEEEEKSGKEREKARKENRGQGQGLGNRRVGETTVVKSRDSCADRSMIYEDSTRLLYIVQNVT